MNQTTVSVLEFCKTRGTSDAEICRIVGAKKDKVNNWRIGRSTPTVEEVTLLAEHFLVSIDCVLGRVNVLARGDAPPEEHWLVKAYGRASDNIQRSIKAQLEPYMEETAQETIPAKKAM